VSKTSLTVAGDHLTAVGSTIGAVAYMSPEQARGEQVMLKLLEKDRAMRYQSAADMRADLQRLQRDTTLSHVSTGSRAAASTSAWRWRSGWSMPWSSIRIWVRLTPRWDSSAGRTIGTGSERTSRDPRYAALLEKMRLPL
jgi:hypothetical protein